MTKKDVKDKVATPLYVEDMASGLDEFKTYLKSKSREIMTMIDDPEVSVAATHGAFADYCGAVRRFCERWTDYSKYLEHVRKGFEK